jgi:N-acetylglucosamine-6-phosphate deacetylase
MNIALKNLVHKCGIETGEAVRMCSLYPAQLMGLGDYGRIEKGSSAKLLVLNDNLDLIKML